MEQDWGGILSFMQGEELLNNFVWTQQGSQRDAKKAISPLLFVKLFLFIPYLALNENDCKNGMKSPE